MCPLSAYMNNLRRAKLRSVPIRTDLGCSLNAAGCNQPNLHPADCFVTDVTRPFPIFPYCSSSLLGRLLKQAMFQLRNLI